jgi:hypothetical protein
MTEDATTDTAADDAVRNAPRAEPEPETPQDTDYDPPGRRPAARGAEAEEGDRDDERAGRREARYRRERNQAQAGVSELEQRIEGLLAREVARIAGDTLEDGSDRVLFMPGLDGVLDDDGTPDPDLIAHRARQLVEWKPGLAKGARVPTPNFGQGRRTPIDQGSGTTWGAVLRGHQ